jgi:hypothetical protein
VEILPLHVLGEEEIGAWLRETDVGNTALLDFAQDVGESGYGIGIQWHENSTPGTESQRHLTWTDGSDDGIEQFKREACTVLFAASIVIGSQIDFGIEELIAEMAVPCRLFHISSASILPCGKKVLDKGRDPDILKTHLLRHLSRYSSFGRERIGETGIRG